MRIERDTMGEVAVPETAKWRAQTQRAVENFPISGIPLPAGLINALALVKSAAAQTNAELGILPADKAAAIVHATDEIAAGKHHDQFPIDVYQTGSGTSSNMNMNEVLATFAAERGVTLHPNDDVNASQSSNDVFPTAMHVAAALAVTGELIPALSVLRAALAAKGTEFADVVKAGRTHLMDATPVTLGQEFGGYAAQVGLGIARLESTLPRLCELPLGGTAVGTGINAPASFAPAVVGRLAVLTGLPLQEAANHFEAHGARDALVETSGQLRVLAVSLLKIVNDLRWMGSGPRAGLAEIALPDLQPGSSIMPGKVNPVLCEATAMVCAQVIGNDAAITVGGASGSFELNVMLPMIARNLLESIGLLANATQLLATRCVEGITANVERCRGYAESTPAIATALNPYLGYEEAAAIAKEAVATGSTIADVVVARGHVAAGRISSTELAAALDALRMARPQDV